MRGLSWTQTHLQTMIGVGLSLLTLITLIIIGADFRSPNVCRVNTYSFERDKPVFYLVFWPCAIYSWPWPSCLSSAGTNSSGVVPDKKYEVPERGYIVG